MTTQTQNHDFAGAHPRFVVQTASAPTKPSWKWHHPRQRVAVIELDDSVAFAAKISERARGVVRIVQTWECCYVGSTDRCQFSRAFAAAERLAAELNGTYQIAYSTPHPVSTPVRWDLVTE